MKKFKKLAAALLAAAMALTVSAPVWAGSEAPSETTEPEPGTITISNAAEGKDYAVYKIFDLS